MHDAQIALPDNGDAVKDGDEQDALGKDAGRHVIDVGNVAGGNGADLGEYLAEHQQPKRRLDRAGDEFRRIVAQLANFQLGDDEGFIDEAEQLARKTGPD